MNINTYPLLRGVSSYVIPRKFFVRPGSGGTFSSDYCYSVWLRHLYYLLENKIFNNISEIKSVAEIGPGDSLGIGIASLYSGVENYYAFDVIKHANTAVNLTINTDLRENFKARKSIPKDGKFINTFPVLPDYNFPKVFLNKSSDFYDERYLEIENALQNKKSNIKIEYVVPWLNSSNVEKGSLDLILSQAVMEHVADIEFAYKTMYKWLRPGGAVSHQVDFNTHEMTKDWNGHWFISAPIWSVLAHGRKYPMNRLPLSAHVNMMIEAGFKIKYVLPIDRPNPNSESSPKVPGVNFSAADLTCIGALIQAVK